MTYILYSVICGATRPFCAHVIVSHLLCWVSASFEASDVFLQSTCTALYFCFSSAVPVIAYQTKEQGSREGLSAPSHAALRLPSIQPTHSQWEIMSSEQDGTTGEEKPRVVTCKSRNLLPLMLPLNFNNVFVLKVAIVVSCLIDLQYINNVSSYSCILIYS